MCVDEQNGSNWILVAVNSTFFSLTDKYISFWGGCCFLEDDFQAATDIKI